MTVQNEKDGGRRRKSEQQKSNDTTDGRPRKKRAETPELGKALRSVYQRTIEESIPPEMLDLLGKLG